MPSRPPSTINRIADGLLERYRRDATDSADKWFMIPKTFTRGVGPHTLTLPAPVLAVSLNGQVRPISHRLMGFGESELEMRVTFFGRAANVEQCAGEVVADLWRPIMEDRQLEGFDDPDHPVLIAGYLSLGETQIAVMSGPTLGEFTIEQNVIAKFTWSSEAP